MKHSLSPPSPDSISEEEKREFALPEIFAPLLKEGHKIGTPTPLFKKIEQEQVDDLKVSAFLRPMKNLAVPCDAGWLL